MTHHRHHVESHIRTICLVEHTHPTDARRPPRPTPRAAASASSPRSTSRSRRRPRLSAAGIARAAGVDRTFLYRHRDLLEKIHALQAEPVPGDTPGLRSPEPRCKPTCSPPTNAPSGSTPASANSSSGSPKGTVTLVSVGDLEGSVG